MILLSFQKKCFKRIPLHLVTHFKNISTHFINTELNFSKLNSNLENSKDWVLIGKQKIENKMQVRQRRESKAK